jgi:hypothetical protein
MASEDPTSGVTVQLSLAVAVPVLAGSVLSVQSTVISAGQVMDGGTVSLMVMNCVHCAVLPHESVAVHVRIKAAGHMPPGAVSEKSKTGEPPQLSVAVAVPVSLGVVPPVQSIVISPGHVITGGVLSNTVIVCVHVAVLPQSSVD